MFKSKCRFTVVPPSAGAMDALSRIAVCYDLIVSRYEATVHISPYRNYHSKEVNFFRVFNVDKVPGVRLSPPGGAGRFEVRDITTLDLLELLLSESTHPRGAIEYRVRPNLYPHDPRVKLFKQKIPFEPMFMSLLTYIPRSNPFLLSGEEGIKRVVAHLRRGDIIGKALFPKGSRLEKVFETIPQHVKSGLHFRDLLVTADVLGDIKSRWPSEEIFLFIASDGVERIRRQFQQFPDVTERIDKINDDLFSFDPHSNPRVRIVGQSVGTGIEATLDTLDAMWHADAIYTASSQFARLVGRMGGAELIHMKSRTM